MRYDKKPLELLAQINKLKERGLKVSDEAKAMKRLASVSYYRLRAYTYPFQNNNDPNAPFVVDIDFDDIFALYCYDHKLRSIIFEMLGIIEVAFRTQIIYQYSLLHGSHWQLKPDLYRNSSKFAAHISSLQQEIERSNERFIAHYKSKYDEPSEPACWMSLEVSSFGLLSKIFQNLKKGYEKRQITEYFGLRKVEILENWLLCFSNLRNICAHHARLWNRRFTAKPFFPNNPILPFLENQDVYRNKLYAVLCCMIYVLNIVRPGNNYTLLLKNLIKSFPFNQTKEMGFPDNWEQETLWSDKNKLI